eukprot:760198-Amphidinium_carterae.2
MWQAFNLFDPENQPDHSADGTHESTSEAAPVIEKDGTGHYGIPIGDITTNHPISPWMVKHDGKSPYSRNWGQKYKSASIAFGETVLCQHNVHGSHQRLEPQWSYGVWIGRATANGNHLTLTSEGVIQSRSVKRFAIPRTINKAMLKNEVVTPRRLEEFQDEFICLPHLVTKYHSKQRAETAMAAMQVQDVMPTPGDNLQAEAETQHMAAAASGSRSSSSDQPIETGQSVETPSTTTFIPSRDSRPTGMPISADSPVIRPPPGLDEPVKYRLKAKTSYNGPEPALKRSRVESQGLKRSSDVAPEDLQVESDAASQERFNAMESIPEEVRHEEMVSAIMSDLTDHKFLSIHGLVVNEDSEEKEMQ